MQVDEPRRCHDEAKDITREMGRRDSERAAAASVAIETGPYRRAGWPDDDFWIRHEIALARFERVQASDQTRYGCRTTTCSTQDSSRPSKRLTTASSTRR